MFDGFGILRTLDLIDTMNIPLARIDMMLYVLRFRLMNMGKGDGYVSCKWDLIVKLKSLLLSAERMNCLLWCLFSVIPLQREMVDFKS